MHLRYSKFISTLCCFFLIPYNLFFRLINPSVFLLDSYFSSNRFAPEMFCFSDIQLRNVHWAFLLTCWHNSLSLFRNVIFARISGYVLIPFGFFLFLKCSVFVFLIVYQPIHSVVDLRVFRFWTFESYRKEKKTICSSSLISHPAFDSVFLFVFLFKIFNFTLTAFSSASMIFLCWHKF